MGSLLGGGSGTAAAERYAGIQVSTSTMGQVLPLVMGRNRVPMNLVWYGDFKSTPGSSPGKGGSAPSSYTYSSAWIGALCIGAIQGVATVFNDKSITSLTDENLALALGSIGQATWSGYPAGTPTDQKIPYSSMAYVASQDYQLGSSASMPNLTYEIEGVVPGYSDAHAIYDADPSSVVTEYLTNSVYGAGFTGAIATLTGTSDTYQAYVMSLGLWTSPLENSQRSATDFMQELMQITNSDLVLSCGTLKVTPYADAPVSGTTADGVNWSYAPDLTPIFIFDDDDYCPKEGDEPVKLTRKALTDTYNIVNLTYNDRANYYNPAPASAQDNNDIDMRGPRTMSTLSFQQVTTVEVAKTAAQLILQFQLYERNTYEFRVRADYSMVEPMDYVGITDSGLGLVNQVVRITKIDDDEDNYFTITAMEVPGTIRNTPQYNWSASQGYYANFGVAPPSVLAPAIFQMPAIPASISNGITVGIAACGPASSTNWGGCNVWCSADGGSNYEDIGTIAQYGPGIYGTLTAGIGAVADPDTTSTLSIALANDTHQISTAVTDAEADAAQTLILVGSGATAEVMAYGSASLVSAGAYNLTYLRRNRYGSVNQAHSIGDPFIRLNGALLQIPFDPGQAGQTLYFKFTSFNSVGRVTQALSAVTAYSYTLPIVAVSGAVKFLTRGTGVYNATNEVFYKSTAGAGAWDSDCYSAQPYAASSIQAQYGEGGALQVGFASSVASVIGGGGAGFYGFFSHNDSAQLAAYSNGVILWSTSTTVPGALFRVDYDGFSLRYYYNGSLVVETQAQIGLLYPYMSMYSPGGVWSDIQSSISAQSTPSQFVATGNCVVNDTNVQKIGGAGVWDSGAYSVVGFQNCHITAKLNSVALDDMFGLSTDPALSPSYTNLNYALFGASTGVWQIYEGGAPVGSYGASSLSDVGAITYDGTTITYLLNGKSIRTVSVSGLTLYGQVACNSANSGLNSIRFGPTTNLAVSDTPQIGLNAATAIYQTTAGTGGAVVNFFNTTSGATALIASLSVPAQTFDATYVVTCTGSVIMYATGNQFTCYAALVDATASSITPSASNQVCENGATSSPAASNTLAIEQSFTVAAGTAKTFYLYGFTGGSSTGSFQTAEMSNVNLKVEVIKR